MDGDSFICGGLCNLVWDGCGNVFFQRLISKIWRIGGNGVYAPGE